MNLLRIKRRGAQRRPSTASHFRPFVEACERRELLASTNFLQGVVLDTASNPLSGATVTLFSLPGNTQVGLPVVTGADGFYSFTNLATGTYKIVETPPAGYSNSSTSDLTHLYSTTLGTSSITVTISDGVPNPTPPPTIPPWLVTPTSSNKTTIHINIPTTPPGGHDSAVGQFAITVNEQDVPFTTSFNTFCVDLNRDILPPPFGSDTNLPYDVQPLATGLVSVPGAFPADAGRIGYLYDNFGLGSLDAAHSAALQLAIWALEYDGGSPTDVTMGTFKASLASGGNAALFAAIVSDANADLAASVGKSANAYFLNGLPTQNPNRPTGSQGLIATDFLNFTNTNQALGKGETATIGFWANKNGQALINSLNTGPTDTALGDWLAKNFPNLYGPTTGTNDLKGKSNSDVAAYFITLKDMSGMKTYAQILGAALAVYVTDPTLAGGTMAAGYGFKVGNGGTGSKLFSVGSNGAAFGVPNNTQLTILQLLKDINANAANGVVNDPNGANDVFDAVNQGGDIS
jgi:hypothetical protein